MNDETQPGNRSVETAEFAAASEFAAESHFSDESEFEEPSSFSAGSVHFTTEFPAVRDFSLDSGVLPAEPEPEPEPEPEQATEPGAAAEPEAEAGAEAGGDAATEAGEPAVTVEVPGRPTAQHPVRTTGELSVLRAPEPPAGIDARPPESLWAYDNYPVAEHVPVADDQAGIVSLGYIGAAIMRKKKVWVLTTVLGILLAGGLYRTYHETYSNTTTVLLALDPSLDPTTAIQTDAILAADSTVAQLTMRKLGVQETIPAFEKTYTVTVSTTSNNLLTFTATGPSANAAYNEANTLASTFLQYRAQTELDKESANTAGQAQQVTQTQQTINSINSQIRHLKDEGATTGDSRLTRLQNQLTSAQNLLASLQQAVASSEASQRSATAGLIADSRVIDTGIPAAGHSKKKFALEYGGAAIFGGLVIGLLIVAIGAVISDRLRRRDDVAAALGAPVRVSVTSGGRRRSDHGSREADLMRVAAHLRGSVPASSEGAGSLVVVAVDDKKFVSEAIRQVAVTAAHEGKRVVVADLAGGALGEVLGSREPGIRPVDAGGVRVVLVTPDRGELAPVGPLHAPTLGAPMNGVANVHAAADLFITLATVNPATGGAHLKTWADDAVAVVTAGESSVSRVQAVGEMIRFAGARLTSAVLLGADENDESLGYATV